jgi:catechol 2,3-dioxygenase-like lactoylglutathione lyase family enzyme
MEDATRIAAQPCAGLVLAPGHVSGVLWGPERSGRPGMARPAAHFVCSDLRVRDLARAVRFYRTLGLVPTGRSRMEDGTRIVWMRDAFTGQLLELFSLGRRSPLYEPFRRSQDASRALIFGVADARATARRLRRQGGRRIREFQQGGVQFSFLRDPSGHTIELLSWIDTARQARSTPPLVALAAVRPGRR